MYIEQKVTIFVIIFGLILFGLILIPGFIEGIEISNFCKEKGLDGGHWHKAHGIECSKTTWHEVCYSENYCRTEWSQQVEHFSSIEKEND